MQLLPHIALRIRIRINSLHSVREAWVHSDTWLVAKTEQVIDHSTDDGATCSRSAVCRATVLHAQNLPQTACSVLALWLVCLS